MNKLLLSLIPVLTFLAIAFADGPKDNLPDQVRQIPPPGVEVPAADQAELKAGLQELGKEIESLRTQLKSKPALLELLPDVEVYHKAVRYALMYREFFNANEIPVAKALLKQGLERARALHEGKVPWTTATGLVVRGYLSKIDGSVQPYGLVVPASYQTGSPHRHRLDLWFHGRGETLSEVNFINQRQRLPGEFTPPHTFVLHPYGRYSNANKFAGEIDTFEALEHVRKHYSIHENRIAVRGFSMGGAACWQFAVHYPGRWAAAAPGAGFSETPDFLKVFQEEKLNPTWYEKKLWHLYDCTDYAVNLFHCPVVAYSGEDDKQKQAADIMARAMEEEKLKLVHIIGPKTGHRYHPQAKEEINRRIDSIMERGRDPVPLMIRFTTWTLRYNHCAWLTIDGMEKHWERARVNAECIGDPHAAQRTLKPNTISIHTENVSALTVSFPPGLCPLPNIGRARVILNGESIEVQVLSDRSLTAHFRKTDDRFHPWQLVESLADDKLRKRHGLQGPIDDAFMDSFLMVRPTGKPQHEAVGKWVNAEMSHAVDHWRRQFRGDARVKNDNAVTAEDIAQHHLILWGDPDSNKILSKIADKLPIRWDAEGMIQVGSKKYAPGRHALVMIYPNPLNPKRYVVLNSGFTFREYDYLNNARQVPKLPDFAVIDITVPVSSRAPGGIAAAGFFGEQWELPATQPGQE